MTKIIVTTLALCTVMVADAQIKNSGFENWSNLMTHVYETEMIDSHNVLNPLNGDIDNWVSDYNVGVSQTTDANSGNYAAIIHNWYNYGKTMITYRDTISFYPGELLGAYKYISDPFMSGTINVIVKSTAGDTIINSDWYLGMQLTWDNFVHPLTPSMTTTDPADSIIINIRNSEYNCQGNIMTCNLLYLDDFSLTQGTASIKNQGMNEFGLYPNPTAESVTLQLRNELNIDEATVSFIDMMGNTVIQQQLVGVNNDISVNHLAPGTYIVQVNTLDGSTTRQSLVIQ